MNVSLPLALLGLVTAFACSPKDDGDSAPATAGASGQFVGSGGAGAGPGSGGSGLGGAAVTGIPPRDCKRSAQTPTFTITGTICGEEVQYSAPEGTRILITHAPFVENVNAFTIADTEEFTGSSSREFLETHDLSFHVDTHESMNFEVGSRTLTLRNGAMDVCGLGTVYFKPETPIDVAFEALETAGDSASRRARVRFSNIQVNGASPEFGATRVLACSAGGELTAVFDGAYIHIL